MNANQLKTGDRVVVCGQWAGVVVEVCRDGYYAVNLDGEGRRVDEWHPSQVQAV